MENITAVERVAIVLGCVAAATVMLFAGLWAWSMLLHLETVELKLGRVTPRVWRSVRVAIGVTAWLLPLALLVLAGFMAFG